MEELSAGYTMRFIIPRSVCPELDNKLFNLEFMPETLNQSKGAKNYLLPAVSAVGSSNETWVYRLPPKDVALNAGDHLITISLHNTQSPSSDLRIGEISLVSVENSQSESKAK